MMSGTTAELSLLRKKTRKRITFNWELWLGGGLIVGLILFALAGLLTGVDPNAYSKNPFAAPSAEHLLGTDNLGRDTAARLSAATRTGLFIAVIATLLAATVGTGLALIAGYFGGVWDSLIMRFTDLFLSIPGILMALVIKVILGPGTGTLVLTMTVIFSPVFARIMRGPVLAVRERGFIVAAEVAGRSRWGIATSHILPNVMTPMLITAAGIAGETVLVEATLSYLGQGVQAPDPSAGRMINEFQKYMTLHPLLIIIPSILIFLQVSAWHLLADGIQNAVDGKRTPRQRRLFSSVLPGGRSTIAGAELEPALNKQSQPTAS